jgi:hypothetical protein
MECVPDVLQRWRLRLVLVPTPHERVERPTQHEQRRFKARQRREVATKAVYSSSYNRQNFLKIVLTKFCAALTSDHAPQQLKRLLCDRHVLL